MNEIKLKKGIIKQNQSRDIYFQKSYIEHIPLENILKKIIIITSYEYITGTLGIASNEFEKIKNWFNKETEKLFEDYKMNLVHLSGDTIIKQFFIEPAPNIDSFLENEV